MKMSRLIIVAKRGMLLLLVLGLGTSAGGHYASVKSIEAETADGLLVRLWLAKQAVIDGHPILVNYKVQNKTARTIYLVWDKPPDIAVDRGTIKFSVPYTDNHKEYNYSFVEVSPHKWVSGELEIPPSKYQGMTMWHIQVGFGYVRNIKGLNRRPLLDEDPAELMGLLNSRLHTFALGYLTVEID